MRILSIEVEDLFYTFDHRISLNPDERVTLIHGPNGVGKTTILRLIHDLFAGSLKQVRDVPFSRFSIAFDDGGLLHIYKGDPRYISRADLFKISLASGEREIVSIELPNRDAHEQSLFNIQKQFPYLRRVDEEIWEDTRDGERIEVEELLDRYGAATPPLPAEVAQIEWLQNLVSQIPVRFIETQRLLPISKPSTLRRTSSLARRQTRTPVGSANNYAHELSSRIKLALAQYADLSQKLDQTFPTRLLEASWRHQTQPVSNEDLSKQILALEQKRQRLKEAGLLMQDDQRLQVPKYIDAAVHSVLSMYLADVEKKLNVFDGLLLRIELFKELLDEHFHLKKTVTTRDAGLNFLSSTGQTLSPGSLSSGEQHVLVLLYELFFTEKPNSLILIDEPEISLHVEWQLSFLKDLQRIASIASHDILIATHSPQIINDRWDLAVALAAPQ